MTGINELRERLDELGIECDVSSSTKLKAKWNRRTQ